MDTIAPRNRQLGQEPRRPHRRDPEGHRKAILEAARYAFTEHGYTRATLRDIARRAGVTHGLIARHFSSKEALFLAALPGHRDLELAAAGEPATLPDRIAHGFIQRMETDAINDPLVAVLRSAASNEHAARQLLEAMLERSLAVYRSALVPGLQSVSDDELEIRVAQVGAHLIGVTFVRYIAHIHPLATMPPPQLIDRIAETLRHLIFD